MVELDSKLTDGEEIQDAKSKFAQGFCIENPSRDELIDAAKAAVEYRGDVSISLKNGEEITGYIFNRVSDVAIPYIELFTKNSDKKIKIECQNISRLVFSGRDMAFGRSWEEWVKKYKEKISERARGEDVGLIGLMPESLEEDG